MAHRFPDSAVFYRKLRHDFPLAVRAEGSWIEDESCRRWLDAAGGAVVAIVGHGGALTGEIAEVDSGGVEHRWPIGQTIDSAPGDSGRAPGRVETSIKWKGDALVVQHRVDGGGRVRESYGVGLDVSRMVVFVEVDAGGLPASFRRQYQRADEGAVSPPGGTASSP